MSQNQDRREAILAAAEQLFSRFGLNKTSMEEVAKLAGVSKPIIYRYFEGKGDLFVAFLERQRAQFSHEARGVLQGVEGYAEKVRTLIRFQLQRFRELELENEITQELILAVGRQVYEEINQGKRMDCHLPLVELLREGIAAGEFRPVDPYVVAMGIDSALRGVALESGLNRSIDETFNNVEEMMEIIVRGLLA